MSRQQTVMKSMRQWTLAGAAAFAMAGAMLATAAPARAAEEYSLIVSARRLKFGVVKVDDRAARREMLVGNDGSEALEVAVVGATPPFWTLTDRFTLQPHQTRRIVVSYAPRAAGISEGVLTITSDDPQRPTLEVRLLGSGHSNFAPPVRDIDGIWTTPQADGFELVNDRSGRWVFGKHIQTLLPGMSGGEPLRDEFSFEAYFDGERLIGDWHLGNEEEERSQEGEMAFELTSDGTLVGRFTDTDGETFREMTLTPRLTSFVGRWAVAGGGDQSWFVLHQGLEDLTGSFQILARDEIFAGDEKYLRGELIGFPSEDGHTRCVLGTVEMNSPMFEQPIMGTFDLYQIATGMLILRVNLDVGGSFDAILLDPALAARGTDDDS